ncbi:MAG: amidohydrolase family protein [Clostridia bacterium]|nr:amidohydrolase family protein [Clostridia bacterium]
MELIDFHTHIYPDKLAVKGSQSICDFYGLEYHCTGSADVLLNEGKLAGISEFLLLPVAVKAAHVRSINDFTAKEVREHKEFHGLGSIHASMEDILSEVERIKALGLKGVKIHPDTQRFAIDDERLYPMYDALGEDMLLIVHCGDPRYDFSRPERLKRVLDAFPKLKVVGAHLGGWSMFDEAFEYLKDTGCYVDISSCIMFIGAEKTKEYIGKYGADKVLFGTDFPLWNPVKEVERFISLNISETDREKIAYKNARRLLSE